MGRTCQYADIGCDHPVYADCADCGQGTCLQHLRPDARRPGRHLCEDCIAQRNIDETGNIYGDEGPDDAPGEGEE